MTHCIASQVIRHIAKYCIKYKSFLKSYCFDFGLMAHCHNKYIQLHVHESFAYQEQRSLISSYAQIEHKSTLKHLLSSIHLIPTFKVIVMENHL